MFELPKTLKSEWANEEGRRLKEGKRRYLHFDFKISSLDKNISRNVWDPSLVARHSFYPLICRAKKYRKYKRDPVTGVRTITPKLRPISYAAHFDSIIYSWYGYILSYFYEKKLSFFEISQNVTGYRKLDKKSNLDFAYDIIRYITKQDSCGVVCVDLEKFFESLDHKILKQNWKKVLDVEELPDDQYAVYKNITRYSSINYKDLLAALGLDKKKKRELAKIKRFTSPSVFRSIRSGTKGIINENVASGTTGIPQGSTISAILSNLYMIDFDEDVSKKIKGLGGVYQRYSDDIIAVCPSDSIKDIEELISKTIEKVKLKINTSKTERLLFRRDANGQGIFTDAVNGKASRLLYLGVYFDGEKILLRHSGIANFQRKMIRTVKKMSKKAKRKKRPLPKKQILTRFFYSGKANYLSYARRAARILDSVAIREQVAPSKVMRKIKKTIARFPV
ncbi:MAG: antiviral reverse transcriptase Drt2 [Candidatus Moraniibacteriota bacterium]